MKHSPTEQPPPPADKDDDTTMLQSNATELAQQDGRAEAWDEDRTAAFREQTAPEGEAAQEIPPGDEALVT